MFIFLATILTTAAVVLFEQFKFHLPARFTIIYSVLFFLAFGTLFTLFADTLNLKLISLASFMASVVAIFLIIFTRKMEAKHSK